MSSTSCWSGAGGSKDRGGGASVGGIEGIEKSRGFRTPVHDKVLDLIDLLASKKEVMIASKEEDVDGLKSESPQEEVNENQNLSDQKATLDIQQDADQE